MRSTELRIGNYVNAFINTTEGKRYVRGTVMALHMNTCEIEGGQTFQYNMIEPVELYDEWMTTFGFEKYNGCFYKIAMKRGDSDGWFLTHDNELTKSFGEFFVRLKHIHELQNFWFASTGRELRRDASSKPTTPPE